MRFFFYPISLAIILLSSCAPAATDVPRPIPETPTPTKISVPLTATATLDPNMPPDATGRNSAGRYIKIVVEDGKSVTYEWFADLNGWFTTHILNGSVDLEGGVMLFTGNQYNPVPGYPMNMYVHEQVSKVPYLRYLNPTGESGQTLSAWIYNEIYHKRYEKILPGNSVAKRVEMSERNKNGTLTVPFSTSQGKEYVWKPGRKIGYTFYAIPWEAADPMLHPEFFESTGVKQFEDVVYRWTAYADENGTLVVLAAVRDPEKLTDIEFLEWILNPIGEVTLHEQLPETIEGWEFVTYPSLYVSLALEDPAPTFEIVRYP